MAVVASYEAEINISRIKDQAFVVKCEKELTEILKPQEALISDVDGRANIYLAWLFISQLRNDVPFYFCLEKPWTMH